jgi:hypothetical protein
MQGLKRVNTKLSNFFHTEDNKVENEPRSNSIDVKVSKITKKSIPLGIEKSNTISSQRRFQWRMNSLKVRTFDVNDEQQSNDSKSIDKNSDYNSLTINMQSSKLFSH